MAELMADHRSELKIRHIGPLGSLERKGSALKSMDCPTIIAIFIADLTVSKLDGSVIEVCPD